MISSNATTAMTTTTVSHHGSGRQLSANADFSQISGNLASTISAVSASDLINNPSVCYNSIKPAHTSTSSTSANNLFFKMPKSMSTHSIKSSSNNTSTNGSSNTTLNSTANKRNY
jgi:hypothetical protein